MLPNMGRVRIGILGCANIAAKYAIKSFQSIENAELISIASRDYNKAKEWANKFGLKAEESYDSLISSKDIDAVYIPLPIGLHKEWVLKAAKEKKHIICEKSMAESFSSVKLIVNICKSNDVVLYENFMCDFHPQHAKVISLIDEGKIGKPFVFQSYFGFPPMAKDNFRYNHQLGGGCLNDAGAYTAFMARKIFAEEPSSVSCTMLNMNNVDFNGSAKFDFGEGKAALLAFSFDAVYQNNYSVWGSKGLVKVNRAYSIPPDFKPIVELTTNENLKETITQLDIHAANHFDLIFHDFCETVINKPNEKINLIYEKILSQAKVLEAMRISAREGRVVKLNEVQ